MLLHNLGQLPGTDIGRGLFPNMLEQNQRLLHIPQANGGVHGLEALAEDLLDVAVGGAAANDGEGPAETGIDAQSGRELGEEGQGLGDGAGHEVDVGRVAGGSVFPVGGGAEDTPEVEENALLEDETG